MKKNIDKSQIKILDISYKVLTKLPDLSKYTNLIELDCSANELTALPNNLPITLQRIDCSNNTKTLKSISELPPNLITFKCSNNKVLEKIPELPNSLERLYCTNSNLSSLPELPISLDELVCKNNKLPYNDLDEYKIFITKIK